MYCLVKCCKNRGKIPGITYHKIPQKNAEAWFSALNRTPRKKFSLRNVICSIHFKKEDFNQGKIVTLKSGVIPSLFLNVPPLPSEKSSLTRCIISDKSTPSTSIERDVLSASVNTSTSDTDSIVSLSSTSNSEKGSNTVKGVKRKLSLSPIKQITNISKETIIFPKQLSSSDTDSTGLKGSPKKRRKIVRTIHTYCKSPRKVDRLQKERIACLKNKLRIVSQSKNRIKFKISHLKNVIAELKSKAMLSENAIGHIEESLSGIPLILMRRLLLKTRRTRRTTTPYPDILRSFAMTLQFYSPKAYEYVRSQFDHCLPAVSTIRKWTSSVDCKPGFTAASFESLKKKAEENGDELLCSFMMDEMHIKKKIEFDNNKTWGYVDVGTEVSSDEMTCATQVLVLMVVSLTSHWKIPIGYFFINSLSGEERANIVKEALTRLDNVNVKILSITCDGPSVNFSMISSLGCNIKDVDNQIPYFLHPVKNYKIFVQLDTCHMMKLMRNNWAALGKFLDPDGQIVDFNYIKRLHQIQEDEGVRAGNKLKKKHIEFHQQKMKVNIAVQCLSLSVANSLEFMNKDLHHPDFENVEATVKFLKLIDAVFDLLNSRHPLGREYKTPMRVQNEELWREKFDEAILYLKNCKDISKTFMYSTPKKTPFLGLLLTINSTVQLFNEYVKPENSKLKYLLTYKFSQDHLELFFCSVRARNGWNNNPSCLQFFHTYKRLLVAHEIKSLSGNIIAQDQTSFLEIIKNKKETKRFTASTTDVSLIRKYDLDTTETFSADHTYSIPDIKFSGFTENVVVYISGYVVRMLEKKIKCQKCLGAIEDYSCSSFDDNSMKLLIHKNRGGLKVPSKDVVNICKTTEQKIRRMLLITENKMPPESTYQDLLINCVTSEILQKGNIFPILNNHIYDTCPHEENHIKRLVGETVLCYSKIRLHSIAKNQSDTEQGKLIRKKFSKLILFNNQ